MVTSKFMIRRLTMWNEEDYRKACAALYRRCQRRGWIYDQPSRYSSELAEKGIIVLRNGDRELGRYDTQRQRLITLPIV